MPLIAGGAGKAICILVFGNSSTLLNFLLLVFFSRSHRGVVWLVPPLTSRCGPARELQPGRQWYWTHTMNVKKQQEQPKPRQSWIHIRKIISGSVSSSVVGSDLWWMPEETYHNHKTVSLKGVQGILVMSHTAIPEPKSGLIRPNWEKKKSVCVALPLSFKTSQIRKKKKSFCMDRD